MATHAKPNKPLKDLPLYAHSSDQRARRIHQRVYYFGSWDDPQAALNDNLDEKDDIFAGRPRPGAPTPTATTVSDVLEGFYGGKERAFETGDVGGQTFSEYQGF